MNEKEFVFAFDNKSNEIGLSIGHNHTTTDGQRNKKSRETFSSFRDRKINKVKLISIHCWLCADDFDQLTSFFFFFFICFYFMLFYCTRTCTRAHQHLISKLISNFISRFFYYLFNWTDITHNQLDYIGSLHTQIYQRNSNKIIKSKWKWFLFSLFFSSLAQRLD